MFAELVAKYHLHPIVDHFTIALLAIGIAAEVVAAAAVTMARRNARLAGWCLQLRSISLLLMSGGAAASVLSYFTGDSEADRLWETMSPAAQDLLTKSTLSHAVLGQYLMYAFLVLATWRIAIELSRQAARTRSIFVLAAIVAMAALLYQGKTGGELVYEHGVGTRSVASTASAAR